MCSPNSVRRFTMRVTMLLADAAQAINGKLSILGGGWSIIGPDPVPSAIAIKVEVPWDEANKRHNLKLQPVDEGGRPVTVPTPTAQTPVPLEAHLELSRPRDL